MQDIITRVSSLQRPKLLSRAARAGVADYRRDFHLMRLLGRDELPRHRQALVLLAELEAEINAQRKRKDTAYSVSQHIDVLIALVGEAQLLKATASAPA